jgi:hypothetical protein
MLVFGVEYATDRAKRRLGLDDADPIPVEDE